MVESVIKQVTAQTKKKTFKELLRSLIVLNSRDTSFQKDMALNGLSEEEIYVIVVETKDILLKEINIRLKDR